VLQEREFERVGGTNTIRVDVRVICATNKNLLEEIRSGSFREDLYYRINAFPIEVPPLRERKDDIPDLASHFIAKLRPRTRKTIEKIAPEVIDALTDYNWPGNIRELENVIEQAMVLSESETLTLQDLPAFSSARDDGAVFTAAIGKKPLNEILEDIERDLIKDAYQRAKKVKTETARLLGIKTSALYYKLEKYGFI